MSDHDFDSHGWDARILETAPKDETPDDVLREIREQPFLNRGRWAALVVRLGAACRGGEGMNARDFDTHRCEGSLAARCSIRRYPDTRPTPTFYSHEDGRWHLWKQTWDSEYDITYMNEVAAIRHCPWCGERLEGE